MEVVGGGGGGGGAMMSIDASGNIDLACPSMPRTEVFNINGLPSQQRQERAGYSM